MLEDALGRAAFGLAGAALGFLACFQLLAVPGRKELRAEQRRLGQVVLAAKADAHVRHHAARFMKRYDEQEREGRQCPHLKPGPKVALDSLRAALETADELRPHEGG